MLSRTVYQGKSAYSWNTTARSHPGTVIGSPPTRSTPRVGCSNPARRLSSVVFPQPLGPTIEKNSLCSAQKVTSSSASSGSPLIEKWTLLTFSTLTCDVRALMAVDLLAVIPRHRDAHRLPHQEIEHQTENADQHHAEQDVIAAEQRARIVDHEAEPARRRDQLAGDQRHPADAEPDTHAGEDLRQRRRQHDGAEQLATARAEAQARANEIRVDVARARHRVQHDGKERCEEDDVHDLHVADAEPQDRQRNPGERRNWPDELENRVDGGAEARRPSHR